MKNWMKVFKLEGLRSWIYAKKHLEKWISYIIMMMCVFMFVLALFSNVAHRLPMLSFFAMELKLPYLLEFDGTVRVMSEEKEISVPITIDIGGYHVNAKSGETFDIKFSAVNTKDIPIVIRFIYDNNVNVKVEYINYLDEYVVDCEYEYILGE